MNAFHDGFRNAQSDVPSLTSWMLFTYRKYAWLMSEQIADLISTQIPHLGNLGNGIVPFSVCRSRCL